MQPWPLAGAKPSEAWRDPFPAPGSCDFGWDRMKPTHLRGAEKLQGFPNSTHTATDVEGLKGERVMVEKYARVAQGLSHHSRTIPIDTPLPTRLCLRALSRHFFPSETPHSHQFCLALAFLPYMGILSCYLGQDSKHMACILHFPTPKPRAGIANRS